MRSGIRKTKLPQSKGEFMSDYPPELNRAFQLARELNGWLSDEAVSDQDRLEIIARVQVGICPYCGTLKLPCHCQNDE